MTARRVKLTHLLAPHWPWLTLALLAYVAVAFTLRLGWWQVVGEVFRPHLPAGSRGHEVLLMVVAVRMLRRSAA